MLHRPESSLLLCTAILGGVIRSNSSRLARLVRSGNRKVLRAERYSGDFLSFPAMLSTLASVCRRGDWPYTVRRSGISCSKLFRRSWKREKSARSIEQTSGHCRSVIGDQIRDHHFLDR